MTLYAQAMLGLSAILFAMVATLAFVSDDLSGGVFLVSMSVLNLGALFV